MEYSDILRKLEYKDSTIISRDKYFNSAVMAVICKIEGEEYFVLQKRAKNIRQGGEISFPGGKHEESDISFLETAIRETEEELGVSREKIKVLGKIGTLIIPTGVIVESYAGIINIDDISELEINKEEVERLLLVPLKFFMENKPRTEMITIKFHPYYEENGIVKEFPAKELGLPERYFKPWEGKPRQVYFYSYEGEVIWGITAEIIIEVTNMLREIEVEKSLGIL
ncbi:CoA pyrophosphatase [uncultured Ilyobacter sp.]|uniref:NUDIX hydrolase n=1 Tax=uncultured Ilyobacter sp. TaxID=544433 RepID=UPI0029C7A219|nr:CoA pyrophosphatase [uncultured Ilyobacter sp.]